MKPYLICPTCGSDDVMKNGTTRRGKQNYKCRVRLWRGEALCGRQFVENPQWQPIDPGSKAMIDRLLLERIPLAGIARVMPVSEDWLQGYVNRCYGAVPRQVHVGCYIGDRSGNSAMALWESLPGVYRQCAVIYTDYWAAYMTALPSKRHFAVAKESGLTSYIERFNNTLRQRVSRLVRKTLSFSKNLDNHIGTIWNFIHHYNELIRSEPSSY